MGMLMPGLASCVTRNGVTLKEWITSREVMLAITGFSTGTAISLPAAVMSSLAAGSFLSNPIGFSELTRSTRLEPKTPSGPGYRAIQSNCMAMTRITVDVFGSGKEEAALAQ